jgi:hypothetical protein
MIPQYQKELHMKNQTKKLAWEGAAALEAEEVRLEPSIGSQSGQQSETWYQKTKTKAGSGGSLLACS